MQSTSDGSRPPGQMLRACENCRLRKSRCNKANPCSNCMDLGIECVPASKPTESRPRVIISNHYERQIEQIQERLRGIELSVNTLVQRVSTPKASGSLSDSSPKATPPTLTTSTPMPAYQGDSSFSQTTIQAGEAAEFTANTTLQASKNSEVISALSSLKASLRDQDAPSTLSLARFPADKFDVHVPEFRLPPVEFAVTMVKKTKASINYSQLMIGWRDRDALEKMCQKVYFPSEPVSVTTMTLLFGLFLLTMEDIPFNPKDPDMAALDWHSCISLCERNFYMGIETYEVLALPTLENAQALAIGVLKAQELSRPFLCASLLSAAANICMTLGYHRKSTLKGDRSLLAESKRHVFWMLYSLEKNLSLNLGRASYFPEYDIDAELYLPSNDLALQPWDLVGHAFIEFARLQGKVYDMLYSARSLKVSPAEKASRIDFLAAEFDAWRVAFFQISLARGASPESLRWVVETTDFVYYSVLTLVHRADPSTGPMHHISSACFGAARLSLECHLRFYQQPNPPMPLSSYIHWVLLYSGFTSFMVVFTHAIATLSEEDLTLLSAVTDSLETAVSISEGSERLYRICRAFYRVAETLVASGRSFSGLYDQQTDSLKLPTAGDQEYPLPSIFAAGSQDNMTDAQIQDMSMFLGDWLGSTQPMTDMLHMGFWEASGDDTESMPLEHHNT